MHAETIGRIKHHYFAIVLLSTVRRNGWIYWSSLHAKPICLCLILVLTTRITVLTVEIFQQCGFPGHHSDWQIWWIHVQPDCVQLHAVLFCAIACSTVQSHAVLCDRMQYYAIACNTLVRDRIQCVMEGEIEIGNGDSSITCFNVKDTTIWLAWHTDAGYASRQGEVWYTVPFFVCDCMQCYMRSCCVQSHAGMKLCPM